MALHLVTGYRGNAHITSADQGAFNAGCVGLDEYVLTTGRMFEAQVVTSNAVRIFDGSASIQGRHVNLDNGTFLDVIISDGLQSMNRNDLIVLRYTKNVVSGIESVALAVVQGALTEGTAVDPLCSKGDILSGATLHEMPLYRVKMSGLNIASVEPLFKVVAPLADIQSGQNLLLNSDFTCNQRRSTSYNANGSVMYSVDMWRIHNIKLDVLTEGVKITGTSSTATGYLTQFVKVNEVADEYTISAMVDGKICTFTTALSNVAAEKQFDNFKITALYLEDTKHIKVNICPNGTSTITIKYVDLYEGNVRIWHIKEDPAVTLTKCRRYIQRNSNSYPIIYSYPGGTDDKKSYKFNVPCDGIISTPHVESGGWGYYNTLGDWISGTLADLLATSPTATTVTMRTPNRAIKHDDCYAIDVWCILTCEHAPTGDA